MNSAHTDNSGFGPINALETGVSLRDAAARMVDLPRNKAQFCPMNSLIKWIGGATVAIVALIGTALIAGNALDSSAQDSDTISDWVASDDALSGAANDTANDEIQSGLALDLSPETATQQAVFTPAMDITDAASDTSPVAASSAAIAAANDQSGGDPITPTATPVAFNSDGPLVIKRILPIEGAIKYGEWHWDDAGVPDGPLVITVDLDARVISVFRGGYEIGAAAALLGTPSHPTPLGTFPILTKERHNVSEKYNNAPMPWTLRLTWSGVAIHGGSDVELGYASHGCVGVPDEFASRLYDIAKKGDQVIITRSGSQTV